MRNLAEKRNVVIRTILLTLALNMCFVFSAFASGSVDFKATNLFKGTSILLWAGTAALTAITVAITIFLSIKAGMAWQLADDQEKSQKKKVLVNTIAIGVLIASLSGLITLILGAYGLADGSGGPGSGTVEIEGLYHVVQNVNRYLRS